MGLGWIWSAVDGGVVERWCGKVDVSRSIESSWTDDISSALTGMCKSSILRRRMWKGECQLCGVWLWVLSSRVKRQVTDRATTQKRSVRAHGILRAIRALIPIIGSNFPIVCKTFEPRESSWIYALSGFRDNHCNYQSSCSQSIQTNPNILSEKSPISKVLSPSRKASCAFLLNWIVTYGMGAPFLQNHKLASASSHRRYKNVHQLSSSYNPDMRYRMRHTSWLVVR
jgi:hypothetical protein